MSQLATEIVINVPCPRCRKPLIDPKGLGWCKACGYCHSLADTETKAPAPAAAKLTTMTATGSAIGQTPTWFWVTLIGIVLLAGTTFVCGRFLTMAPLERALLTTIQIVAGLACLFVGQFIALMRIAPEDSTLGFWDAIFPFRLYGFVFKRLPATRHTVYLGAWGVAAIVAAAVFIGGLGHWLTYLPNSQKKLPNQVQQKAKS